MLTIIRPATNDEIDQCYPGKKPKSLYLWLCKCDCGNEIFRSYNSLSSGEWRGLIQNCGCRKIKKYKEKYDSIIGKEFGSLTVISYDDSCGQTVFKCKCKCGNETTTDLYSLTSGHKKSCGCLLDDLMKNKFKECKRVNLVGKQFGKLTVISETEDRDASGCVVWKCQCECGNFTFQPTTVLTRGAVCSCGCIHSKGEMAIGLLLDKNNITFQRQYWFDDLRGGGNRPLMFDFAVFDASGSISHLIEYDGSQHFEVSNSGWNTQERHDATVERDKIKTQYCLEHGIPLIRIPYTRFNELCLDDLLLPSTDFLCAG